MIPATIAAYRLTDAAGRNLGQLHVERIEGDRVCGTFERGEDYDRVEPIFIHFSNVVEQQTFSYLDAVDAEIAALDLRLSDGTSIHDVQIYSDGNASFRIPASPERNGRH